jgi:hypothetical protein
MSPERRRRIEERTQELLEQIRRREELLKAIADAQRKFAVKLGASAAAISELEQQPDLLLKTLAKYFEGLGAELVVSARFPEGDVELTLERGEK